MVLSDFDKNAETDDGRDTSSHPAATTVGKNIKEPRVDRAITFTRELFVVRMYWRSLSDEM